MTPHIEAKREDIKKVVIMPGDPERAKRIAEKFLEDVRVVSEVRGMTTYTGKYKGKELTVMPSGMGIPSMGIYSYELFKFYDVDTIIKVGTCGSYVESIDMGDILLVEGSFSESTYPLVQDGKREDIIYASRELNQVVLDTNKSLGESITKGIIHCSDVFYEEDESYKTRLFEKYKCIACEMESFSLFHNANKFGKRATEILTVTDNLVTGVRLPSDDRQNKVDRMLVLALESVLHL